MNHVRFKWLKRYNTSPTCAKANVSVIKLPKETKRERERERSDLVRPAALAEL